MAKLDEDACVDAIQDIFSSIAALTPMQIVHGISAVSGKLYELYCVGRLLELFENHYGLSATFQGTSLALKTSGGFAYANDPHFDIWSNGTLMGKLFTDIEIETLGAGFGASQDLSAYHEIDIVLLKPNHAVFPQRPSSDQLLFGVECKANADFKKSFVREVLGRRRELSLFTGPPIHGPFGPISANPPAPYWLVYIDPAGDHYKGSPAVFGVTLEHWLPI